MLPKGFKVTITPVTSWKRALNASRVTVGKEPLEKNPTLKWRLNMLIAEHSPIRLVEYDIFFKNIPQWNTVHLIRHWLGFIPFVWSQREDRRKLPCKRADLPQGALNNMMIASNAQALINVSHKRLCRKASPETREIWEEVKKTMESVDPEMAKVMVPECVYRGFCPERKSCGYYTTKDYTIYRNMFKLIKQDDE